ncbi:hypothetical protein DFA_10688 [Cavenderia fasciculata]|uniref:PQ-loop repeat-containing protein n=1 Tax=Cavenderia fasciculata TaxID=261658 RepID=F4QB43_CACFS|nr:uncharacterized protein DFA_10688 [Cavenderia fasciculata]EGG14815.1 hypothetical protein DFA_10688 [Cavenderia fasciculata]|eukprot:XP_004351331.1 hypothetical protein DFA_10688 [Cavenderia fasciculata]
MDSPAAANVFGYIGVVLWSIQLLPQIRWNYIRKSTEGVSILCFSCWYIGGLVFCPYLVATESAVPLILQIALFSILILVILFQHCYYDKKIDPKKLYISLAIIIAVSVGIAYGLYALLDHFIDYDFEISLTITIISASLMAGGFIPAVYEILKSQSAEGLSRIFVAMDFLGGTASILSLVFAPPFDYMSFANFVIVPCFEGTIFFLSFYYGTQVKTKDIEYEEPTLHFNRSLTRSRRATTQSRAEMSTMDNKSSQPSSIVI